MCVVNEKQTIFAHEKSMWIDLGSLQPQKKMLNTVFLHWTHTFPMTIPLYLLNLIIKDYNGLFVYE